MARGKSFTYEQRKYTPAMMAITCRHCGVPPRERCQNKSGSKYSHIAHVERVEDSLRCAQ